MLFCLFTITCSIRVFVYFIIRICVVYFVYITCSSRVQNVFICSVFSGNASLFIFYFVSSVSRFLITFGHACAFTCCHSCASIPTFSIYFYVSGTRLSLFVHFCCRELHWGFCFLHNLFLLQLHFFIYFLDFFNNPFNFSHCFAVFGFFLFRLFDTSVVVACTIFFF